MTESNGSKGSVSSAPILLGRPKTKLSGTKERVIVRFSGPDYLSCDIELPLHITSNDLIIGLNEAYHLGIDLSDTGQHYLSCENPIVLLKGNRTLAECGVRDGSLISYNR